MHHHCACGQHCWVLAAACAFKASFRVFRGSHCGKDLRQGLAADSRRNPSKKPKAFATALVPGSRAVGCVIGQGQGHRMLRPGPSPLLCPFQVFSEKILSPFASCTRCRNSWTLCGFCCASSAMRFRSTLKVGCLEGAICGNSGQESIITAYTGKRRLPSPLEKLQLWLWSCTSTQGASLSGARHHKVQLCVHLISNEDGRTTVTATKGVEGYQGVDFQKLCKLSLIGWHHAGHKDATPYQVAIML